ANLSSLLHDSVHRGDAQTGAEERVMLHNEIGLFLRNQYDMAPRVFVRGRSHISKEEIFLCDPTLLLDLYPPTTNFLTTPRNAGSCPNCKDKIQWFSSSAAEVTVPRIVGSMKGLFNSIMRSRLATVAWSRLAPTILPRRMNIAAESVPTGLSFPTRDEES